jgi:hypothetical protein
VDGGVDLGGASAGDRIGVAVQTLFSMHLGSQVVLDLIALEPLAWAARELPAGTPFTLTMKVPPEVADHITAVTDGWADRCCILGIGIGVDLMENSELVLLDGPEEQLVLETIDQRPGWGA